MKHEDKLWLPCPEKLGVTQKRSEGQFAFFFLKNEMGGKGVAMLPVGPPDSAS